MRKTLTILSTSPVLVAGTVLTLPIQAQTTGDRGLMREKPAATTTDQSDKNAMSKQMSEMMKNCNSMMRSMQQGQMPNQQGSGSTSPRSGN